MWAPRALGISATHGRDAAARLLRVRSNFEADVNHTYLAKAILNFGDAYSAAPVHYMPEYINGVSKHVMAPQFGVTTALDVGAARASFMILVAAQVVAQQLNCSDFNGAAHVIQQSVCVNV